MCGFIGIFNKNQITVNSQILKEMASVIHYRGPDEEGQFIDGPVGFYHKRLSIIDLSTGQQPMTLDDCTIVGSYLSGGIDSSFVTILSASKYVKEFTSFTGSFKEGPEYSELDYAREAAKVAGSRLYEVVPEVK